MRAVQEIFDRVGCKGWLCVLDVHGTGEVVHHADELVVPASVMKVQVALEVESCIATGELDPRERVRLRPSARTPGPTGISLFHDDVEVSVRDLLTMMLTISDNAATDALLELVGLDAVNATAAELGLRQTTIRTDLHAMIDSIGQDAGFADYAAMTRWSADEHDPEAVDRATRAMRVAGALNPQAGSRTTARQMATLLRLIWTDRAGPAPACARVRETMQRQLTRNRIAAGFGPRVRVAAKSGGLMGVIRNEIGVVASPEGGEYAVAVFTRAEDPAVDPRPIDAAIGEAAAYAVGVLHRP